MVSLGMLWLPILVATVVVFVTSNLIWQVIQFHKNDWAKLPDEEAFAEVLNAQKAAPGEYSFPHAVGAAAWKDEEFQKKFKRGPVGFLTLQTPGKMEMGKTMACWVAYIVVIQIFIAYLTGRTVPPGADFLDVFQVAGTVGILGYAGAIAPDAIWLGRQWSNVTRMIIDGIIYGLLSAVAYSWLWPAVV